MNKLFLMAIAMLFLFSCSEDQDLLTSLNQENQLLSQRSQSPAACGNLLQNGDFTNFTEPSPCDEVDAFGQGRVSSWVNGSGTPDLLSDQGWTNCWSCPSSIPHAARLVSAVNNQHEGILQNVFISSDPDIYYSLCFDAYCYQTTSSPPVNVTAYFTNGLTSPGPLSSNANLPNLTGQHLITSSIVNGGDACTDDFTPYFIDQIRPSQDYSQIFIFENSFTSSSAIQPTVYLRNVVLNCHSDLVKGIIVDKTSKCSFDFNPDISVGLTVLEYIWDFGDGSTSSSQSPSHTYSANGIYKVTLTVKDENGCCTTVETAVFCGEEPICLSHLCWEDFQSHFDCARGIIVELPTGMQQTINFTSIANPPECLDQFYSTPIPAERAVVGGHCEIKHLIIHAIQNSTPYDVIINDYRDNIEECFKDQPQPPNQPNPASKLPGFFITSQVKVLKVFGTDCNGNPASLTAEFNPPTCQ